LTNARTIYALVPSTRDKSAAFYGSRDNSVEESFSNLETQFIRALETVKKNSRIGTNKHLYFCES
jgi:hypothetical protein